jgi:hypothetical protein
MKPQTAYSDYHKNSNWDPCEQETRAVDTTTHCFSHRVTAVMTVLIL